MIKLLDIKHLGNYQLELHFSDATHGVFDGDHYLESRQGPLLEALRDPVFFDDCFIDAGALCWPNGLELSAARLQALIQQTETVH